MKQSVGGGDFEERSEVTTTLIWTRNGKRGSHVLRRTWWRAGYADEGRRDARETA